MQSDADDVIAQPLYQAPRAVLEYKYEQRKNKNENENENEGERERERT